MAIVSERHRGRGRVGMHGAREERRKLRFKHRFLGVKLNRSQGGVSLPCIHVTPDHGLRLTCCTKLKFIRIDRYGATIAPDTDFPKLTTISNNRFAFVEEEVIQFLPRVV